MEFLVNDLSFEGQFQNLELFRNAIRQIMEIRQIARRFGRELYCHRNLAQARVMSTIKMQQAVQMLRIEERRALMQWLTQYGPFWEDMRNHGPDDWLECNDNIVTDTAVGEAAWCCLHGIERGLISLVPSNWQFSPVHVEWKLEAIDGRTVDVMNYWNSVEIEAFLQAAPVPLSSWEQLETLVKNRCDQLIFTIDAFVNLNGCPFVLSAAQRLRFILETLNRFKSCFDTNGQRTVEGHRIYKDFFTGKKEEGGRGSLFSDSSDEEKNRFESKLQFKHPVHADTNLFCPWHGKVQTPPLRVHFSWPVRADEPLYVVYIGPKITKK